MNLKYSNSNSYPQNPNAPLPDSVAFNPVLLTISPRHGAIQTSQRDRTPPGFHSSNLQTDRPRKRIFDAPKQANLGNISQDIISGNSFTRSPKKDHNRTTTNISTQYQNNISVENAPDRPKHPILGPQAQHTRYIAGYRDISPEPQPKTVNMNKPTLSISPNKQQMPHQSNIRGSVFESFAQDGYFIPSHNYSDSTSTKLTSPSGSSVVDSMKGSVGMFGSVANPFVHQPQSFYVDGATHPDLDTSCTSSAISQTSSRRRMKPIVVMNINIGNGKKEEIRVHEGDDPLELANAFCKSYKLPKTLVQVLGNNIMSQVNNYYALKAQKTTRKLSDNYQQFSEPAQPHLHSQMMNQNYNNTVENDPRMSEKVSHNRPLPHSLPQNPALEDSSCQNQADPRGNETNRSRSRNYPEHGHHRVQTSPGRYTEDDDFDFVKGTSRRHEMQKTEGDFEEYEKSDNGEIEENEKENDDSGSDTDKARLEELEEQIKKLQQKKEKYLAKVQKPELKTKQNKSMVVSKSSIKDIQNKEAQSSRAGSKRGALVSQLSPLSSIPEGRSVNANKPLSTRNIHGRENVFESENKQQNKVRKSPVRAQAQARIDTGIRNTNKGVLTPRQLQNANEYERDYSPQNTRLTPKSPLKSPLAKDTRKTTPKNAVSTQMKPYPELKTGSMLLPENKMSLKSNEDDESRVQRKGYNQSVKVDYKASELNQSRYQAEEEELKMQVLTDIFKSLDDDFDGNISSEHVDISSFDDKILDSMSEILEALEAGMVLTFKDFCNIVNQRKLLDALKKKYSTGPVQLGTPERNKSNNYEITEKPFLSPKDSAPSHDSPSTAHDSKADGESSLSLRSTFKDTLKAPSLDSYGEVDLSNRYLQVTDKNFGKKTFV